MHLHQVCKKQINFKKTYKTLMGIGKLKAIQITQEKDMKKLHQREISMNNLTKSTS